MSDERVMLKVTQSDGVAVVRFRDNFVRPHHLKLIEHELKELVDRSAPPMLVLDFHKVEYFPSTGLGILIGVLKRVRVHDGELRLANMSDLVRSLFQISGLDRVFLIHETVNDAAAAFAT